LPNSKLLARQEKDFLPEIFARKKKFDEKILDLWYLPPLL